ncbi:MAG TPA: lanthionine synthetase C family protein [Kofleriaceae bacterium]|nr:lanthionine synthetase C family protein [Kofleriaceae bacterium]
MSWSPLLDPDEPRVAAALDHIIEAVAGDGAVPAGPTGGPLTAGAAGWAVLCAYAGREEAAERHLDAAFAEVADVEMDASLFGGFTGVGWADAHLHPEADAGEEVDELVLELVSRAPWPGTPGAYDLVSGLVGLGVYALERRPRAAGCLEAIALRLDEVAAQGPDGVWRTPAEHLPAHQRERAPAGLHDLGVAHGVAGAIAFLAGAIRAGVEVERCRRLLERAVPWLLARRQPDGMPAQLVAGEPPRASRLAWCYGDPGTAAALLLAANATGDAAWRDAAVTIAREAAARPPERTGVVDAMLCHGAAGLGHIFNRLHQATGDPPLRDAAIAWFERALDMRRPGEGVGGFRAHDGVLGWHDDGGLLTGSAGVALALLAATRATEPAWDRLLLLSLR